MGKVRIKLVSDGKFNTPERKVLSEGRVYFGDEKLLKKITECILNNKEAWIGTPELGGIRVIGMLDTDFKEINPWAQIVGEYKNALKGAKWEIVDSSMTIDQARLYGKSKSARSKRAYEEMKNVTPDLTIVCPQCGYRMRVGKKLV